MSTLTLRLSPDEIDSLNTLKNYLFYKASSKAVIEAMSMHISMAEEIHSLKDKITSLERTISERKLVNDNFLDTLDDMFKIREDDH